MYITQNLNTFWTKLCVTFVRLCHQNHSRHTQFSGYIIAILWMNVHVMWTQCFRAVRHNSWRRGGGGGKAFPPTHPPSRLFWGAQLCSLEEVSKYSTCWQHLYSEVSCMRAYCTITPLYNIAAVWSQVNTTWVAKHSLDHGHIFRNSSQRQASLVSQQHSSEQGSSWWAG